MVGKAHEHGCYQNKVPIQFGNWRQTLNLPSHLKALLCVVICLPFFSYLTIKSSLIMLGKKKPSVYEM
jgi:hypothetical protein